MCPDTGSCVVLHTNLFSTSPFFCLLCVLVSVWSLEGPFFVKHVNFPHKSHCPLLVYFLHASAARLCSKQLWWARIYGMHWAPEGWDGMKWSDVDRKMTHQVAECQQWGLACVHAQPGQHIHTHLSLFHKCARAHTHTHTHTGVAIDEVVCCLPHS